MNTYVYCIKKMNKRIRTPPKGPFVCYALVHQKNSRSYTGQTNNFERRLRQHNGEISGGARYTSRTKDPHYWTPLFIVAGFQTIRSVLQFELAMKKRKVPISFGKKIYTRGPGGRVRQLEYLLSLGRLNSELHSPFAENGIRVECRVSIYEYLRLARITEEEFWERRRKQRVPFHFTC